MLREKKIFISDHFMCNSFKYRCKPFLCLFLIFLLLIIPVFEVNGIINTNLSNNDVSSLNENFDISWLTDNGSLIYMSIDPKLTSLKNEETYFLNITIESLAFAPNQTSFSAINITIRFRNSINNIYTESVLFPNLTTVHATETKFVTLTIPAIEDIPMRSTESVKGNMQYMLRYNETFISEIDADYSTGWQTFASTTLRNIPDSFTSIIVLVAIGGMGALFLIFYLKSRKNRQKREFRQPFQRIPPQVSVNGRDTEQKQRIIQEQIQSQPYSKSHITPQMSSQAQIVTQQIALSQQVTVCAMCNSINLLSSSSCVTCGGSITELPRKKKTRFEIISFKKFSITILILSIVLEAILATIITSLFVLSGETLNFQLDFNGDIIKTSELYMKFVNFCLPFLLGLIVFTTIIFNILSYYLLKREIILEENLNLYKIRVLKRYYLLNPIINMILIFMFGVVLTSSNMVGNYDFVVKIGGYSVIIGLVALPVRIWIYKRKFILPRQHVVIPSTQIYTQLPTHSPSQLFGNRELVTTTAPITSQSPNLEFICRNCKNLISKTATFCPECGTQTERCRICKLPFESTSPNKVDQIGLCPKCESPFHMKHIQESIKVTGKCPVCKETVQAHEIKRENM